jgi:hypothetical protein
VGERRKAAEAWKVAEHVKRVVEELHERSVEEEPEADGAGLGEPGSNRQVGGRRQCLSPTYSISVYLDLRLRPPCVSTSPTSISGDTPVSE